jgi:hypothetical protein
MLDPFFPLLMQINTNSIACNNFTTVSCLLFPAFQNLLILLFCRTKNKNVDSYLDSILMRLVQMQFWIREFKNACFKCFKYLPLFLEASL